MTTDYEIEEQAVTTDNVTADEAESESTTSKQSEDMPTTEALYFWSEPGVCG